MREYPNWYPQSDASGSIDPITMVANEVVVDYVDFDWNSKHSSRLWKARQKQIAMYKQRVFVDDPAEVVKKCAAYTGKQNSGTINARSRQSRNKSNTCWPMHGSRP